MSGRNNHNVSAVIIKKITWIIGGFFIALALIFFRLVFLQIIQGEEFKLQSERNQLRVETLESRRGSIVDYKGRFLATNRPVFDLYWQGSGKRQLTPEQKEYISFVQSVCTVVEQNSLISRISVAEKYGRRLLIARDCSFTSVCQISEQCANSPNLIIINHFKRFYPYASSVCHVVGYIKPISKGYIRGEYGLEKIMNSELEGEEGYVVNIANSMGKVIQQHECKEAFEGKALVTTLDIDLQQRIERLFSSIQAGACIVMEPETGAIRAMVSHPTFDPMMFVESVSQEAWSELFKKESPFLNRAVHASYPPASLFKVVTCTAGLELGFINETSSLLCRGYSQFCNRNYFCVKRAGHGILNCREFLAHSCNTPCYEIAKHIAIDQLAEYAFRFGLGATTKCLLNDHDGLVPTTHWKQWNKNEPWWKGETLSASIGQSYLLATPLQMIRLISSLSCGYLVTPRILEREPIIQEPLFVQESTLAILRDALHLAVQKGTARSLKSLSYQGFDLSVKTGTAQTSSLERARQDKRYLEHGWVASYFRYKNEKPLACIIVLERTGASKPALAMLRRVLEEYKEMKT